MHVAGITVVPERESRSLPAVVARAAAKFGDRPFLLGLGDEPAMTFAEFDARTDQVAAGLAHLLEPGEPVGLLVPTTNRAVVAVFSVIKAGAVPVILPNQYRGDVLGQAVRTMLHGSRVIAPRRWHHWLAADLDLLDLGSLPHGHGRPFWLDRPPTPDDLAVVLPTSGTTGVVKGVRLPHGHGVHYGECTVAMRRMGPDDGVHGFAPIFHVDGLQGNVVGALLVGARVALSWPVALSRFWAFCRDRNLTTFAYAGGLIAMLAAQPPRADDAANPLRVGSGAPSPPDLGPAFERRFGLHLTEGYGSTEAGIPLIAPWDDSRLEDGSCGQAVTGYDVQLADDGELMLRPHDPSFLMQGYVGDDEATKQRLPGDGWFHSGDLLAAIGDGHFAYRGRKDEMIRRRGESISPVLLERAALAYPGVMEAAAYGVPGATGEPGEHEVALAVVWVDPRRPDQAGLEAHLRGHLPAVAVPAEIRALDELPLSPGTGKVQKLRLPGAQGPSGPSERTAQGPSGPSERTAQGPSGPSERTAQGPSGPSERTAQGPSGPSERTAQGPSGS